MAVNSLTSCLWFFLTVFWLFSLKLECDKLASEKSEMQRHYVMVRTGLAAESRVCGWQHQQVSVPGLCLAGSPRPTELQGSQRGWNWLFAENGAVFVLAVCRGLLKCTVAGSFLM